MGIVTWVHDFLRFLLKCECKILIIALCEDHFQPIPRNREYYLFFVIQKEAITHLLVYVKQTSF